MEEKKITPPPDRRKEIFFLFLELKTDTSKELAFVAALRCVPEESLLFVKEFVEEQKKLESLKD